MSATVSIEELYALEQWAKVNVDSSPQYDVALRASIALRDLMSQSLLQKALLKHLHQQMGIAPKSERGNNSLSKQSGESASQRPSSASPDSQSPRGSESSEQTKLGRYQSLLLQLKELGQGIDSLAEIESMITESLSSCREQAIEQPVEESAGIATVDPSFTEIMETLPALESSETNTATQHA